MPEPIASARSASIVLSTAEWQARASAHLERVRPYTQPRRERRARGESHPVHDFLFQYYSYSAGKLETWHPAPHEGIAASTEARERFRAPVYRVESGVIRRDVGALTASKRELLGEVLQILRATRERTAHFGCHGMHEWAMVYGGHDVRHAGVAPLRLPQAEIDALVESRPVACSHFDAFRFFAPAAKPMNRLPLAWATRYDAEQPGCIHANMDLYRWAYSSMPWVGSDLLAECFALAMALRDLDMEAGPYDLRAFGVTPVPIETPAGRDEYQRRQRALAVRADQLRASLIDVVALAIASS
ncbi:3-methyladenine DNA glycosylase [Gemmatimonas sp.]|jgi:hypothetical protein|uniref:3-methyladenine DNA glycosylase n=1 Tax=Gemmatimonas sp. TaxID=1962908 RepID=UPI0037C05A0C